MILLFWLVAVRYYSSDYLLNLFDSQQFDSLQVFRFLDYQFKLYHKLI